MDGTSSPSWHAIPSQIQGGIKRYIESQIPPGSCLTAILSNNLQQAFAHADPDTQAAMGSIVVWLYNYAPSLCWGSDARVDAWLGAGAMALGEVRV